MYHCIIPLGASSSGPEDEEAMKHILPTGLRGFLPLSGPFLFKSPFKNYYRSKR
jgi:hypothetical protein